MAEKIKPCPFCGSKDIEILEWTFKNDINTWQVECQECGVSGSMYSIKAEAVEEWNRRADDD